MKLEGFSIKAHEFKHPIAFERKTEGVDDEGLPLEDTWETYFSTRCKVINVNGNEFLQSRQVNVEIDKTFYIRARRDKELTTADRILYKGKYYNIVYVNNVQDCDLYVEIKAKLVK